MLVLSMCAVLGAGACKDKNDGAATTASASAAPSSSQSATAAATATAAPTTAVPTATPTAASPAFPPKELCGKYNVSAPPDAKLEAGCFITADAYRLVVKPGKPDSVKKLKELFGKAKDFKGFVVDDEHGFVAPTKDKGGVAYLVMYSADIGGKPTSCESTLTKSPSTEEKAKEAFAVCKSLAAK